MSCDDLELALLDAGPTLPPDLAAHLVACARCRAFHADAQRALALATLPPPGPREELALAGLASSTAHAFRAQERRRGLGWQVVRLAVAAGLGAVVAMSTLSRPERVITREVPVLVDDAVALDWPAADGPNLSDDDGLDEVSWPSLNEGDAP